MPDINNLQVLLQDQSHPLCLQVSFLYLSFVFYPKFSWAGALIFQVVFLCPLGKDIQASKLLSWSKSISHIGRSPGMPLWPLMCSPHKGCDVPLCCNLTFLKRSPDSQYMEFIHVIFVILWHCLILWQSFLYNRALNSLTMVVYVLKYPTYYVYQNDKAHV